jgi:hypothetical protein
LYCALFLMYNAEKETMNVHSKKRSSDPATIDTTISVLVSPNINTGIS